MPISGGAGVPWESQSRPAHNCFPSSWLPAASHHQRLSLLHYSAGPSTSDPHALPGPLFPQLLSALEPCTSNAALPSCPFLCLNSFPSPPHLLCHPQGQLFLPAAQAGDLGPSWMILSLPPTSHLLGDPVGSSFKSQNGTPSGHPRPSPPPLAWIIASYLPASVQAPTVSFPLSSLHELLTPRSDHILPPGLRALCGPPAHLGQTSKPHLWPRGPA